MKKIILGLLFCISLLSLGLSYNTGGYDEGDLYMDANSIRGNNTTGLYFDPDNDGTNEIIFDTAGYITSNGINITSTTIDANSIETDYLTVNSTSSFGDTSSFSYGISAATGVFSGSIEAADLSVTTVTALTPLDGLHIMNNGNKGIRVELDGDVTIGDYSTSASNYDLTVIGGMQTPSVYGDGIPGLTLQNSAGASIAITYSTVAVTATELTASGNLDVTNTITGGTLTDGTLTINSGQLLSGVTVEAGIGDFDTVYTSTIQSKSPLYILSNDEMYFDDINTTSLITLSDSNNAVYNSDNQTLVGSVNNVLSALGCAGLLIGGAITDNLDGTVDVASGQGYIRIEDSSTTTLKYFTFSAASSVALTDNSENYIYIDYNSGTPVVAVTTSGSTIRANENDQFEIGEVYREGTDLHITMHNQKAEPGRLLQQRLYDENTIIRANAIGGLILGETGTRNVTMSAGKIWIKLNSESLSAIDTSVADTFVRYYQDGVGGWTEQTAQTQWNNTQYDDGSGSLASIGVAKYSFQEFYIESDGGLVSVFGQNEYNSLIGAENAGTLSTIPDRLGDHALYIGRIVFQQNDSSAQSVLSPFTNILSPASVTNHNNLANLDYASAGHTGFAGTGVANTFTSSQTINNIIETSTVTINGSTTFQRLSITGQMRLNEDAAILGGDHIGLAANTDVLIVADVNDTSGLSANDIIMGAGSSSTSGSDTWANIFPTDLPRNEFVRIKGNSGRVGIGTNAPDYELDVVGNINADYGVIASSGTFETIIVSSYTVTTGVDSLLNGSYGTQISSFTISAEYDVQAHDATLIITSADAGAYNVILPVVASSNRGRIITVINSGADNFTVEGTINGGSNYVLIPWAAATFQSDGTSGWVILSTK